MKVKAKTHWVWTEKAAERYGHIPGSPIHRHYLHVAPVLMIEDGLIIDSSEFVGQADLFSVLEGVKE